METEQQAAPKAATEWSGEELPQLRDPALLVGLGGSGVRTLRVIKGVIDSGGNPALTRAWNERRIRLLGIDTDPASNTREPVPAPFGDDVSPCLPEGLEASPTLPPLDEEDFLAIDAATQPRAFGEALEAARTRRRQRETEPTEILDDGTLADWFPLPDGKGDPPFGPACESGAGHWRPVGRLALYSAAGTVLARLRVRADGFPTDAPPARAFVVGALGGGTGGGMFWDVALMLRALGHPEQVYGAFLLPDPDGALDRSGRALPNAYAVIKECIALNHWPAPLPGRVAWPDGTALVRTRESGPVFNDIFLYRFPPPPAGVGDARPAREWLGAQWLAQNLLTTLRPDLRLALENEEGRADREAPARLALRPFATSAASCYPLEADMRLVLAVRNRVERLQRDAALPGEARAMAPGELIAVLLGDPDDKDTQREKTDVVVKALALRFGDWLTEYVTAIRFNLKSALSQLDESVGDEAAMKRLFHLATETEKVPLPEDGEAWSGKEHSWLRQAVLEECAAHRRGALDLADYMPEWAQLASALFELNQRVQLLDDAIEEELSQLLAQADRGGGEGARAALEVEIPRGVDEIASIVGLTESRKGFLEWVLGPLAKRRVTAYKDRLREVLQAMDKSLEANQGDDFSARLEGWLSGPSPVASYLRNRLGDLLENSRYRREQLKAMPTASQEEPEPIADEETDPRLEQLLGDLRITLSDPNEREKVHQGLIVAWHDMASELGFDESALDLERLLEGLENPPNGREDATERLRGLLIRAYSPPSDLREEEIRRTITCLSFCVLEVVQRERRQSRLPRSLAGAVENWHGAVFQGPAEAHQGESRHLMVLESATERSGPCGSPEQRLRRRFAMDVEQHLGLLPRFHTARSGNAMAFYQARCLPAHRLQGIDDYRDAYQAVRPGGRRFHHLFPEALMREAPDPAGGPAAEVHCGNPECSRDIAQLPRTELFCPGCGQAIRNRCGNEGCDANDLADRWGAGAPPEECPACGGPMHTHYWYCPDPAHHPSPIAIEQQRCPLCEEEAHRGSRQVVHHRPGAEAQPCPGCVTLGLPAVQRTTIPVSLAEAFWNGVPPAGLAAFETARRRLGVPPLACPQGAERHLLFPACPDPRHAGGIGYLHRDEEGHFRCADHPQHHFHRCFHCDYPVETPRQAGEVTQCPRCLRRLQACPYCSEVSQMLVSPSSGGDNALCPRCGNRMTPIDPLHAEALNDNFDRPGFCSNLWRCAAAAAPWGTVGDRANDGRCRACAESPPLLDRRQLRRNIERCPLCRNLIGLPDGTGVRRTPTERLLMELSTIDEQLFRPDDPCPLCDTRPAQLLWWLTPSAERARGNALLRQMTFSPELPAERFLGIAGELLRTRDDKRTARALRERQLLLPEEINDPDNLIRQLLLPFNRKGRGRDLFSSRIRGALEQW